MTPDDYQPFQQEFTRLSHALNAFKQTPEQIHAKADAYFHALKKFPFTDVCAKADAWLQTEAKFPKPVEWANQVVRHERPPLHVLTTAEATTYRDAERQGWEAPPCECARCLQAGVHEKPIRFVPEFDRHDVSEKVVDPIGNRIVVAGHWAHGRELAGYYEAWAGFWNRCLELGLLSVKERANVEQEPIEKRLEKIFSRIGKAE